MQNILKKANEQFENQHPFVLFANPNSNELIAYFQNEDTLTPFEGQEGFVFTSFDKKQSYVLKATNCTIVKSVISNLESNLSKVQKASINTNEKAAFENLVKKSVGAILEDKFKKVVVSRKVILPIGINCELSFLELLSTYGSAFRYWFYHPKIGMWMGASPEQLLYVEKDVVETVALAGTQLYAEAIIWETKEKEEQQFVTDYIVNQISSFVEKLDVSNPYTVRAGNLAHIKTTIKAKLITPDSVLDLVTVLHPTSAICGLPKESSLEFIIMNEGYDRLYYSGYLGEWSTSKKNLFVNLRCMEIENESVHLYVGCGITKESIPEKEFYETQNKLGTMLKVIKLRK